MLGMDMLYGVMNNVRYSMERAYEAEVKAEVKMEGCNS